MPQDAIASLLQRLVLPARIASQADYLAPRMISLGPSTTLAPKLPRSVFAFALFAAHLRNKLHPTSSHLEVDPDHWTIGGRVYYSEHYIVD
jgi:hypothetical protein